MAGGFECYISLLLTGHLAAYSIYSVKGGGRVAKGDGGGGVKGWPQATWNGKIPRILYLFLPTTRVGLEAVLRIRSDPDLFLGSGSGQIFRIRIRIRP